MNISKAEQRTLHALARGGRIVTIKDPRGDVVRVECVTREGWVLTACTLEVFRKMRRRRFIASHASAPYAITRTGLEAVRAQVDNR